MEVGTNTYAQLQHELDIDTEWIQGLQDYFADLAHLYLFLLGDESDQLTQLSGDPAMFDRMRAVITPDQIWQIYNRLVNSTTEEQVIENTEYSNVIVAGIAVKAEGATEIGRASCRERVLW